MDCLRSATRTASVSSTSVLFASLSFAGSAFHDAPALLASLSADAILKELTANNTRSRCEQSQRKGCAATSLTCPATLSGRIDIISYTRSKLCCCVGRIDALEAKSGTTPSGILH